MSDKDMDPEMILKTSWDCLCYNQFSSLLIHAEQDSCVNFPLNSLEVTVAGNITLRLLSMVRLLLFLNL